jgi:hypothetical protein
MALSITRIKPDTGWPGTLVSIFGANFSDHLDGNAVDIGGTPALVVRAKKTELQVLVGEKATSGPVVVKFGGSGATSPTPFKVRPAPNTVKASESGAPVTFHGPQHGTPTIGVENQEILVLLTYGSGNPPVDPAAEQAAEMAALGNANRYWNEVTYASDRTSRATTFRFTPSPWVALPQVRNRYVWDNTDMNDARAAFFIGTKRWAELAGDKAVCAHRGGGIVVTNLASPPAVAGRLSVTWVARHVAVHGQVAFVAAGPSTGLVAVDISATPTELGRVALGGNITSCAVNETGDILAVGAMEDGVEIYDVNDPAAMARLATIPTLGWVTSVKISGTNLVGGVGNRLAVWDISNPRSPINTVRIDIDRVSWITGVDVDAAGNTCVVSTDGAGVAVVDITPAAPVVTGWARRLLRVFSIRLSGTTATAACGPDGLLVLDVSDPSNVVEKATVSNGSDCLHATSLFDVGGTPKCMASFGALGLAAASLGAAPSLGAVGQLPHQGARPAEPDIVALRTAMDIAIDSHGMLKDKNLLIVEALEAANRVDSLDRDFEGVIVVIRDGPGRGSSWISNQLTSNAKTLRFDHAKGYIWLAGGSHWGRIAHEIGHWFGMADLYSEWYSDGTVEAGTAEAWDLGGDHDRGALFSGYHAQKMQVYDDRNVKTLQWDPGEPRRNETFAIAAHAAHENSTVDGGAVNHLLRIMLTKPPEGETTSPDSLSYYIEVRQKPGTWSFDGQIPLPGSPGAAPNGTVLVTRVEDGRSVSNSFERRVSLFRVLGVGESVVDAGRLIRITAESVLQADPLVYRVRIEMNDPPPADAAGLFNLKITRWNTDNWETEDIWVNSPRNDRGPTALYEYHAPGDDTAPVLNGDRPWVHHNNTLFAKIRCLGPQDATDVLVTAYTCSPPGIGDNGTWEAIDTKHIPLIEAGKHVIVPFDWTPEADKHTCLKVAIFPQHGERDQEDNSAQENVFLFDSAGSSSHEPVIVRAMVRSPFTVWRFVDLVVRGLPDGWHATVDKRWVWVPPKGEVPVTAVIWTDKDSPRASPDGQKRIAGEARVKIEGWTTFGNHRYVPIGGILAAVKANARAQLKVSAHPVQSSAIRVSVQIIPVADKVPGAVEVRDVSNGRTRLVNYQTRPDGTANVTVDSGRGKFEVQGFSASTAEVAEAESPKLLVVV